MLLLWNSRGFPIQKDSRCPPPLPTAREPSPNRPRCFGDCLASTRPAGQTPTPQSLSFAAGFLATSEVVFHLSYEGQSCCVLHRRSYSVVAPRWRLKT